MLRDIAGEVRTLRVMNSYVAGVTTVKSTGVDMANNFGFGAVRFTALFGALTANQVTTAKIQHSDTDVDGNYVDVADSTAPALADGDSNKAIAITILQITKRFYRCVVIRGTANAVIDGVIAEVFKPNLKPVLADSSVQQLTLISA